MAGSHPVGRIYRNSGFILSKPPARSLDKHRKRPERGDFCYLDFTPHSGSEKAGRRPALILSPRDYNIATGLALACPVTNQPKGSPFEVAIPPGARITGVGPGQPDARPRLAGEKRRICKHGPARGC